MGSYRNRNKDLLYFKYFITMSDLWHSVNIWSAIGE